MITPRPLVKHPGQVLLGALLALTAEFMLQEACADLKKYDLTKQRQPDRHEWAFTSMSWHFNEIGLCDTGSARSHAVLLSSMDATKACIETEMVIKNRIGDGWKISGVSLYQDIRNYWHLALVESPGNEGTRFIELRLMRNGIWGAEAEVCQKVPSLSNVPPKRWVYEKRYRLRLEITGRQVRGQVWDNRGQAIADMAYTLLKDESEPYYPSLINAGFQTCFLLLKHRYVSLSSQPIRLGQAVGAYGFFRTDKIGNYHWLRGPTGEKLLLLSCELVNYGGFWCQALGYAPYHERVKKLFGSESAWAIDASNKLRQWGFNAVGHVQPGDEITRRGLAYTTNLRMGQSFCTIAAIVPSLSWTGFPDVFDERFQRHCRTIAEKICRPWRNDSLLFGYYIDNELEWLGKDRTLWSLFTSAMMLGSKSAAKKEAINFLRLRYGDINSFNSNWKIRVESWEALAETSLVLVPCSPASRVDADEFVRLCARKYFETTVSAIRTVDPNHLVLGARFAWETPEAAWLEAGRYCDVVSLNCYSRVNILSEDVPELREKLEDYYKLCTKPLLISEWSFPALDAGLPSTHGAGMRVDDQDLRAYCASKFQEETLSMPFVVGTSWFMWSDEPAFGVTDSFPENSNYGLVDVRYRPYLRVASALASVNRKAGDIHAGRVFVSTADSLRQILMKKYDAEIKGPRPSMQFRRGRLAIDNGTIRLVLTPGKSTGVDSIYWNGIPMGGYHHLLWQRRNGDGWLKPNKITGFAIENVMDKGLTLLFTAEMTPDDTSWCRFSVSFRVTLPPSGSFILVEVTEIANQDKRQWCLIGYYHYIPSWLAGDERGDFPYVPTAPNYWLRYGGWVDLAAGLHFGALALKDKKWTFQPYIDSLGRQHPDIFRYSGRIVNPQEAIKIDDGPLVIYLGRNDQVKTPWAQAAFQAWEWLKKSKTETQ